jgi:serine/threonine-protein kinase RsbW
MQVRDQGPGFDPGAVPDPTTDENLERGSGRGLLLIRAYMSRAEYLEGGRMLRMVYQRPPGA